MGCTASMGSAAQRKLKRMIRFIEKWPKSHEDGEDDEEEEYDEYDAYDEYPEYDEGMMSMVRGWCVWWGDDAYDEGMMSIWLVQWRGWGWGVSMRIRMSMSAVQYGLYTTRPVDGQISALVVSCWSSTVNMPSDSVLWNFETSKSHQDLVQRSSSSHSCFCGYCCSYSSSYSSCYCYCYCSCCYS